MQEVRASPVAGRISFGPKLCVLHGGRTVLCSRMMPSVSTWLHGRCRLKFEGGAGSSMALWPCLDGFTAAVTILGVNPVNFLPKCLPVCSTSQTHSCANLPWHMIARNGFQLWTYAPRIMELRASRFLFTWPWYEISLPSGKLLLYWVNLTAAIAKFDQSL